MKVVEERRICLILLWARYEVRSAAVLRFVKQGRDDSDVPSLFFVSLFSSSSFFSFPPSVNSNSSYTFALINTILLVY